jgi:hypothetical protein
MTFFMVKINLLMNDVFPINIDILIMFFYEKKNKIRNILRSFP